MCTHKHAFTHKHMEFNEHVSCNWLDFDLLPVFARAYVLSVFHYSCRPKMIKQQ